MSSFDLTSPVVRELRAAPPVAPAALRSHVLEAARREPEAGFALPAWPTVRRAALVAVPACFAIGVGAAVIGGIARSGGSDTSAGRSIPFQHGFPGSAARPAPPVGSTPDQVHAPKSAFSTGTPLQAAAAKPHLADSAAAGGARLAPSTTRLQDYRASLTIRVDGLDSLSPATQKAMRTARELGGYVVSASYDASKQGYSDLVFRIPVTRVQQAIARFSDLGTIAAQNIQITDLQGRYNRLVKQIDAISLAIAKIDDKLANPAISNVERVGLEQQRTRLVAELRALTTAKGQTVRQARLATMSLTLTTEQAVVVHKPHHQGTLGGAIHDAGTILAKELAWALYALVILGPLAAIALLAFLLVRVSRRYADRRLLETS